MARGIQRRVGADLMIKGLQMAEANPTHASVIKALCSIKAYYGSSGMTGDSPPR